MRPRWAEAFVTLRLDAPPPCLLHDGCPASCEYRGRLTEAEAANLAGEIGGAPAGGCVEWAADE
jgi:hypothetical protein